jgi:mannose-1-phosphate guanylyltransferase / mannose-6-phosphate isomerase
MPPQGQPVIHPAILSGGSGTRLWPMSRAQYPKQLLPLLTERTLLQEAGLRVADAKQFAPPLVISNDEHRFIVAEQLRLADIAPAAIILEPLGRNTAPACCVAALTLAAAAPDALMLVMPSDHAITDQAAFKAAVARAAAAAAAGRLVTFGIAASRPDTGYGYIKRGAALGGFDGHAFAVESFAEKPDRVTAERYVADGAYFWNSGIFALDAKTYLAEIERLEPKILAAARAALAQATEDLGFLRLDRAGFAASPNISIDYAVMEKTRAAAILPMDVGWNDVGSWSSLWDIAPRDDKGNFIKGEAVLEDTSNCYVHSERSIVSTIGVSDLVIVNTPDALLVADKSRTQDVSKIVQRLKQSNRKEQEQHLRNYRPWGYFETLNIGPRFQVKLLHVKPGGKLSMQMHHHRSEHWIVVQGTAEVSIGDREQLVRENESVYIFATQWHRLQNPGKVPVEIIEVQIGSYLGEDDIMRTDDIYHRAPEETK